MEYVVRIYYIFLGGAQTSFLSDKFLLAVVFALNIINGAILLVFELTVPYQESVYITDNQVWPVCTSAQNSSWMWILLSPVLVMILMGLFLSIQTRAVQSEFNESGLINRSIYITTLNLAILIPLNLTLKLPSTIRSITTLIVCLTLFTVIGINFIPKILATSAKKDELSEFIPPEIRKNSMAVPFLRSKTSQMQSATNNSFRTN
ncbi:hypothetical protein BDR26DRAFT_618863 [Obelidium mucronatum]|nr:hypothetical protein BDR26DRAFT_618863 [Obelidium mucronatum]